MKLQRYIVAIEASNSKDNWQWLLHLENDLKEAQKQHLLDLKAVEMWPNDYRNPQLPQLIELDVTEVT